MSLKTLLAQKKKAQTKVAKLEAQIKKLTFARALNAHLEYGYSSRAEFIKALKNAEKSPNADGASEATPGRKTRRRAVITAAIRAKVKKLAQAGATGAVIAKKAGISLPSVQNIKKALGLVHPRSKAPKAAK